jgi:hypothetical protein
MMKKDDVSKTQEIIKKESASAVVIINATETKTEVQEGVRKDTIGVDKDETDEEEMTKKVEQCLQSLGYRFIDAEREHEQWQARRGEHAKRESQHECVGRHGQPRYCWARE